MTALIVGAGIFGLTIAKYLAERGLDVTIVDKGPIPNPFSSSFDHHRLIRFVYGDQKGYGRLVPHAFAAWENLFEDIGEDHFLSTGCLSLGRKGTDWLDVSTKSLTNLNLEYEVLSQFEAQNRFPWLRFHSTDDILYSPDGGILRADKILANLAQYLKDANVRLIENCEIESFEVSNCRVASAVGRSFSADILVTALGAWHSQFFESPVRASRQVYARSYSPPAAMTVDAGCPMILDLEAGGGFYFIPGNSIFPSKYGNHISRHYEAPSDIRELSALEVQTLCEIADDRFSSGCAPDVDEYGVCYYSMVPDEQVRFEQRERYFSISGGSGHSFKWGALFGKLIADAITAKRKPDMVREIIAGRASI